MALSILTTSTIQRLLPRRRWTSNLSFRALYILPPCRRASVRPTSLPTPHTGPPRAHPPEATRAASLVLQVPVPTRAGPSSTPNHTRSSCRPRGPLALSRTSPTDSTVTPCPAPFSLLCRYARVMRNTAAILGRASHLAVLGRPNYRRGGLDSQSLRRRAHQLRSTPAALSDPAL